MFDVYYDSETYDNFEEFKDSRPDLAKKLLSDVDEGEWMNEQIYYYPTIEDFAIYELTEGWYIDYIKSDTDLRGAPDPLDYIDYEAFGEALTRNWDGSIYWSDGECVVSTNYGW